LPVVRNITAGQSRSRPLLIDLFIPDKGKKFQTVVFFHGTKGFKDWGAWPLMHPFFNQAGLALVTVNFSHNGVGGPQHSDFTEPAAFAENDISLELEEMKMTLDWFQANGEEWNLETGFFHICGHSRAGGEAIVFANRDVRVDKVVVWAPVTDFLGVYSAVDMKQWEKDGFIEIVNSRTGQKLPVNLSFVRDIQKNQDEFNILQAASRLDKPLLLIHGEKDEAVPPENSDKIYDSCLHSLIIKIAGANHTFGISHPWNSHQAFPTHFLEVLDNTVEFINS
jgi:pimeloyl-ACP methyl ester carboxylesterase